MDRIDTFSQDRDMAVERLLSEWNQCKAKLAAHFRNRESDLAEPLMQRAILLFEQFLILSNSLNQDVHSIKDCKIKPVNAKERLDFIVARPKLFHSYKQLAELFAEQEKQFAKQAILNKSKNKRPD
ncbi:YpoC family protein [Bacillus sp. ISL-45]|uniref:YpoC family protein n=1 Tax=Bacillus sp. ISL-45 TaxID=2819128 RepID=UPI001BEAF584|nr:hypothetical protein [Bacillus sp. ISL-45]MBT2662323.1 hypothetical protein [Bacillus sp. ISL-45]